MSEIEKFNGKLLELSQKERGVVKALIVFNQLRAFKLDVVEVLGWKDTLLRVMPDIDVEVLRMAVDALISGKIPYDQNLGIRNIIIAVKRIYRNDDGKLEILTIY
jgi:hypothetical protein